MRRWKIESLASDGSNLPPPAGVFPKKSGQDSTLHNLGLHRRTLSIAALACCLGACVCANAQILAFDGNLPVAGDPAPAAPAAVPAEPLPAGPPEFHSSIHEIAALELRKEEQQRVLRTVPEFNISDIKNAAPLSPEQKLQLAFRGAIDPSSFAVAGFDAWLSQRDNDFGGYGRGADGYAKRYGASFTDSFNGTILGNALFPILLHQDPRYFRKNTGSFKTRLLYALASIAICKGDNGKWQPNYSNLLGNLAAGGISNLYYPPADRGATLTIQRAMTVTAEGVVGNVFFEFWPDISRKLFHPKK